MHLLPGSLRDDSFQEPWSQDATGSRSFFAVREDLAVLCTQRGHLSGQYLALQLLCGAGAQRTETPHTGLLAQ